MTRLFAVLCFALATIGYQQPASAQFTPPGKIVRFAAGTCTGNAADIQALNAAALQAGAGNTVRVATNNCSIAGNWTPPVAVYWFVPPRDTWTLNGPGSVALPSGSTIDGVTTCNVKFDLTGKSNVTIGNGTIGSSRCGIDQFDITDSRHVTIINNDLTNVGGAAPPGGGGIFGWSATGFTIDGNHFNGCSECLNFANGGGANSTITRNVLQNTKRAYLELGYDQKGPPTTNLRVTNNWASRSTSTICGDACLAYSVVADSAGSRDNIVSGNYAQGNLPNTKGICIEFANSGEVQNNICDNWYIGAAFYLDALNGGATISGNNISRTHMGFVPPEVEHERTTMTFRKVPPQPVRIAWGGHRSVANSPLRRTRQ